MARRVDHRLLGIESNRDHTVEECLTQNTENIICVEDTTALMIQMLQGQGHTIDHDANHRYRLYSAASIASGRRICPVYLVACFPLLIYVKTTYDVSGRGYVAFSAVEIRSVERQTRHRRLLVCHL